MFESFADLVLAVAVLAGVVYVAWWDKRMRELRDLLHRSQCHQVASEFERDEARRKLKSVQEFLDEINDREREGGRDGNG